MERMLSGIKPSGNVTLGNYLGAIQPFVQHQNNYDLFVFIADLHALTIYQEPKDLKENIDNLIAIYLAAGLDPNSCTIFRQSDIPAHNQLEWVLTCNTHLSDLTNMPQYKNYVLKSNKASFAGMLMYPSLMNADVLLYDTKYVPTGIDQRPHVELTRDIAEAFNKKYGETFVLPESVIQKQVAKIMSLSDPSKKMSKSESDRGTIYLLEDIEISKKKIMRALTDSENEFKFDPISKPGLSNLITIYGSLKNVDVDQVVKEFNGCTNYGVFKQALANILCETLFDLQEKVHTIKQSGCCEEILAKGKEKASKIANSKIKEVYNKIGL